MINRGILTVLVALLPAAALGLIAVPPAAHAAPSPTGSFDYAEALQDAMFFYQAQRSGPLPPDNEVSWRGDSDLSDGSDNGVNLTGGYHDAGDLVKFGLPEAWAMNMLAWGLLDYPSGYQAAGQTQTALQNLRWGDDYILAAATGPDTFYGQVADPNTDHSYWGPAETNPTTRPSQAVTASCAGSDLVGQASAALAASSIVFKTADPKYSAQLLSQAESLFTFADTHLGNYASCITSAQNFYNSFSGYWTQLVAAEIWIYKATGTASWLTKAETDFANMPLASQSTLHEYNWTVNWDDDSFADYVWMAQLTGQQQYITDAEDNLDWWTTGFNGTQISYSPGGEAFLNTWGSLRYSSNAAYLALEFSNYLTANNLDSTRATAYHNFAVQQINYILGQNPNNMSYEVGFTNGGKNTAWSQFPHNSTAHDAWSDNLNTPAQTRHLDYGLLVGGPTSNNDQFQDVRSEYQYTEGALDYNALFSGDLAALTQQYGGTPIANFPAPETPDGPQIYLQAAINNESSNFIEIKALVNNQSAWPARQMPNASFRYYFTLDPGETPSQISLSSSYNQCDPASGPFQYSGSTYYIQVSCANLNVEPVGEADYTNDDFQAQVQFRITFPSAHNPAEDWSFQGIPTTSGATPVTVSDMTLYSGNTLVWGSQPPASSSAYKAPGAPGALTATSVSGTGATLTWTAATAGTNPIAGYDVYTSAGTLVATTTSTSAAVTGLNASRTSPYGYYVTAVDNQGVASAASNTAQFITSGNTSSTASAATPPTSPGSVVAGSVSSAGAVLSWAPSAAGSSALTGYRVYELAPSTGLVATVTSPTYTPTGLTAGTTYAYDVEAIDSAGRTSQFAPPATFYTGSPSSAPSPSASPTPTSASPTPTSASPTPTSASPTPTSASPTPTSASPTPTSTSSAGAGCTVAWSVLNSWSGGFQLGFTVTAGAASITAWTVRFTWPGAQTISQIWNASATTSGSAVTIANLSYNGSLSPGGSTTFGMLDTGTAPTSLTGLTCST